MKLHINYDARTDTAAVEYPGSPTQYFPSLPALVRHFSTIVADGPDARRPDLDYYYHGARDFLAYLESTGGH